MYLVLHALLASTRGWMRFHTASIYHGSDALGIHQMIHHGNSAHEHWMHGSEPLDEALDAWLWMKHWIHGTG
jgi:hypothetical protein